MSTIPVVRHGDTAIGHIDAQGNPVTGVIVSSSTKGKSQGNNICVNGDLVVFPSHPHTFIIGVPGSYSSHSVPVTATGKMKILGKKVARHGDIVPVADGAGPNATMVASGTKAKDNG